MQKETITAPYGQSIVTEGGLTTRFITVCVENCSTGRVRYAHYSIARDIDDHKIILVGKYMKLHRRFIEVKVTAVKRALRGAWIAVWDRPDRPDSEIHTVYVRRVRRCENTAAIVAAIDGYLAKRGFPTHSCLS